MVSKFDSDEFTATRLRIALNEIYPEATYGAIPIIDQCDALEAYLALDDGALIQAIEAFGAYVIHQQPSAVQGARKMQRPPRPDGSRRTANLPSKKFSKTG